MDGIDITDEMMTYYKEATGIPDYINTIEEAHLKSKHANLPISNDTLFANSTKVVLASDDFPRTTDEWEDLNTPNKTWYH